MTDGDLRFARCLAFVLKAEGGFGNDPKDPGGPTNMGITIGTLSVWLKRPATIDDIRNLDRPTATLIYRHMFWGVSDNLPAGIDLMYFNAAVNCGHGHAAEFLQRACGAPVDGEVGPMTLRKVAASNIPFLIANYRTEQRAYYQKLHGWDHDGSGWTNRLTACAVLATQWAQSAQKVTSA